VFIASLLRDAAARLHIWFNRSSSVEKVDGTSYSPPEPSEPAPPPITLSRPIKLVDRIRAGREAVGHIHIASPPRRTRPIQPLPTLWNVKSGDAQKRLYCGPVAVAALIGADVDEVIRVIQLHRNNRRQVRGTNASELHNAFRHFGCGIQLVADLSRNSPTLAIWERDRTDLEFEQAWLLVVTGHWVAVRGRWFVDTFTAGKPVRITDAPRRRKRVRYAYRVHRGAAY
jgi:hypothetical protein